MATPSWADSFNYTPSTSTGVGGGANFNSYFQPSGGGGVNFNNYWNPPGSAGSGFNPSWSDAVNYKGTGSTTGTPDFSKYWDSEQQQQPKKFPWEKALGDAAKGFLSSYAQRFKPGATGSGLSGQSGTVGDLSAAGYGGRIYGGQDGLTFVERGPSQVIQGQPGLGGPIGTALGIAASFIPGLGPGIAAAMPAIGGTIGGMVG
jgi:hypothetical protein